MYLVYIVVDKRRRSVMRTKVMLTATTHAYPTPRRQDMKIEERK